MSILTNSSKVWYQWYWLNLLLWDLIIDFKKNVSISNSPVPSPGTVSSKSRTFRVEILNLARSSYNYGS
ncbi:hypothetical protein CMV_029951 [Castanea mollissima]|uniref:Uncharacterized protein n=1 Tax=Castanea mollissima TaxID=60419 RepID=A0A8J4Q7C0_9ROSI|nr:hypothetical protein CMV_029951 [Castanea mollissima]